MDSHLDKNPWLWTAAFIILAVAFQSATVASPAPPGTDLSLKARLVETYGKLPLSFELNRGQTGDEVNYYRDDRFKNSRTADGGICEVQKWYMVAQASLFPVFPNNTTAWRR